MKNLVYSVHSWYRMKEGLVGFVVVCAPVTMETKRPHKAITAGGCRDI